jgi:gliding motility-associated protein GldC
MKTAEINFKVTLDENNLPIDIEWTASDTAGKGKSKAIMIAIWDPTEGSTLRFDLWTKDMMVDEMKQFFHQNLLTMSDTFKRATGEENIVEDLKDYCDHFAEKMEIKLPPAN